MSERLGIGAEAESDTTESRRTSRIGAALDPARRASVRAFARLPRPVRLLWISLAILGGYAIAFNLNGVGLASLIALPLLAAEIDILFQFFRFRSIRAPDAALATGMLLALVLPPAVPLLQAGAITVAAITLRHVLRYRERPVLNAAASGVLLGTLLFGMAPAWWGSISLWLVVALGIAATLRTPGSWRLPAGFLAAYAAFATLQNPLLAGPTSPQVLLLRALDPSMFFFGLFMVPEPRTTLIQPMDRLFFGVFVGMATAFLPALIPSLAPFVALLLGNLVTVVVRRFQAVEEASARTAPSKLAPHRRKSRQERRRKQPSMEDARPEWNVGYRVAAGLFVFVVVGAFAFASTAPSQTPFATFRPSLPASASAGNVTADCSKDNPSVSSDVLNFLHQRLGPSVILSTDPNSGTVVFYDPVNHATITETDMYEDFGYAEFNGDDYAVMGCSP